MWRQLRVVDGDETDAGGSLAPSGVPSSPAGPIGALRRRLEAERDRWFLWLPVLYGAGVAFYFSLDREPLPAVAVAPALIALVLWLLVRRGTLAVVLVGSGLAVALGLAAAKVRTAFVAAPVLERQISLAEVRGWIELVEPRVGRGQRLTVRVASIRGVARERLPYRVRVRTMTVLAGAMPGEAVRLRATLAPPSIPALPGDYDFARAAYFQRLGGVGYALARVERDQTLGEAPLALRVEAGIARVRQAIGTRVRSALSGERGAIADALITGERGGISVATNAAYRDSGLFHILSISGLHMTIMAGAVFLALRVLLAAFPAVALGYPVKKWAAAAAALAALGYLLISGSAFATVRSWVMVTIMFLAILLDRPAIALRNVAATALIILIVLPDSILDVGFQMSFAAVVAIVAGYEVLRDRMKEREGRAALSGILGMLLFLGGIVLTTLIASLAVAPLAAYHFHKSQQYAILANLIGIPICNVLVMPAALATLVVMPLGLEAVPLWVMGLGIDIMTWCAYAVASLPGAVGRIGAMPQSAFVAMVLGGLWLCLWRTRWRLAGFAGFVGGVALIPTLSLPDLLVGHEGQVVAARGSDGNLSAIAQRSTMFELSRWLEHDGDARQASAVADGARGFRCDAIGCTAVVKGVLVSVARHPAAVADDCGRAGLLVMTIPRPASCQPSVPVIDLYDLRDKGTHAVHFEGGSARIVTVADVRGQRPWTGEARGRGRSAPADARRSRLGQFAAPVELSPSSGHLRPEIEDDDPP